MVSLWQVERSKLNVLVKLFSMYWILQQIGLNIFLEILFLHICIYSLLFTSLQNKIPSILLQDCSHFICVFCLQIAFKKRVGKFALHTLDDFSQIGCMKERALSLWDFVRSRCLDSTFISCFPIDFSNYLFICISQWEVAGAGRRDKSRLLSPSSTDFFVFVIWYFFHQCQ